MGYYAQAYGQELWQEYLEICKAEDNEFNEGEYEILDHKRDYCECGRCYYCLGMCERDFI